MIPARGGSKRIPNKNIRIFSSKPIIAYSIDVAKESGLFDQIIVSTDSEEIAEISRSCGANVPFLRPIELADDYTCMADVILHALKWLIENQEKPEIICCILPTAPFIQLEYLVKGYEIVRSKKAKAAQTVTTFPYPILRAKRINKEGKLEMVWPEHLKSRSQDLPEYYHDAAQFYWYNVDSFIQNNGDMSGKISPIILPRFYVQDIDTVDDWRKAEIMFEVVKKFSFVKIW